MPLGHLEVHQFRNLTEADLTLSPGLQIISGENASGKTSLLEAIHLVCSAKSFLAAAPRKMQQFEQAGFSVAARVLHESQAPRQLKYQWSEGNIQLSIGADKVERRSDYAAIQPVQAITPYSYRVIDESPDIRRRLLDWGVFHVKPDYAATWRQFQRSLSQRNQMLVAGEDLRTLKAWSEEYYQLAESVHAARRQYFEQLLPVIQGMAAELFDEEQIQLRYQPGWDLEKGLQTQLEESLAQDLERRFTYYGPQRADLNIQLDSHSAKDSASRGQKKLLTFALYLAQARLQQQSGDKKGIILVDDLPSELDQGHQARVLGVIQSLDMQSVVSCIDPAQLALAPENCQKRFHVKQGQVTEMV